MAGIKIAISKEPELKKILAKEGFEFLEHQYAFWRARKGKSNVIFYKKGTLLIQGTASETLQELLLKDSKPVSLGKADQLENGRILGMDESGKGDCFGPLVLAAAIVPTSLESELYDMGVTDSKKLSDETILPLAQKLSDIISCQVRVILPSEYNKLYEETGNLNKLMTGEYRKLITSMQTDGYTSVILDNYSLSSAQKQVIEQSAKTEVLIIKQAERYPSVAAASILARAAFVRSLRELSQTLSRSLPKGSGHKAQELFRYYRDTLPASEFSNIAKTHFKIH